MIRRFERILAKLLFPGAERWQQKRNVRAFLLSLVVGAILASVIGFMIYQREGRWN